MIKFIFVYSLSIICSVAQILAPVMFHTASTGIVTNGLITSYDFITPGSGNTLNDKTGANNATLTAGSTWTGTGILLDNTHIASSTISTNSDEITIAFVMSTTDRTNVSRYFFCWSTNLFCGLYGFLAGNYELFPAGIRTGSAIPLANNNPHYLSYSRSVSGNHIYGYLDSTQVASYANNTTTGAVTAFAINSSLPTPPSDELNATYYYFLVYNRALSPTELVQNYNALKAIMALRGITI